MAPAKSSPEGDSIRRIGGLEGDYEPQKQCAPILNAAMAHIQSVPYKVTLRWLFYRLLQEGVYKKKQDYLNSFDYRQRPMRKSPMT